MIQVILSIPSWLIPLAILGLSVLALAVFLERLWFFQIRLASISPEEEKEFLRLAEGGDKAALLSFCAKKEHPLFWICIRIADAPEGSLSKWLGLELPRAFLELKRGLPLLGTISTIAPLFGLLGTVTGMVQAFHAFGAVEGAKSLELTGGIDEALITTALGLLVAIPSLVAYNYFANKANQIAEETEGLIRILAEDLQK